MKMNSQILTSEEIYDLHWWFVLEKIKKELLKNDDSIKKVIYTLFLYPTMNDPATPNSTEEQLIISKLEKSDVIKETEETTDFAVGDPNPKSVGLQYYLQINNVRFDKIYDEYKTKVYPLIFERKNLLMFSQKGAITYYSPEGKIYQSSLTPHTIAYKVLSLLAKTPHRLFEYQEIITALKGSEDLDERKIRDAIQMIKGKLKYHGKHLFKTQYGFEVTCDVLIIE